jgi:Spherulation-specific family 4
MGGSRVRVQIRIKRDIQFIGKVECVCLRVTLPLTKGGLAGVVFPPTSRCIHILKGIVALALFVYIVASSLSASSSQDDKSPRPGALVPTYFYPSGKGLTAWQQLAKDAREVRIEVILNPASGPGKKPDPTYVTVVRDFRKAGGRILGYISTNYAKRDIAGVERDLRSYLEFYEVDGIFLDEMPGSKKSLPYYQKVHRLIKDLKPDLKIVGNPGQPIVDEGYMKALDCVVLFEGSATLYAEYNPQVSTPWTGRYPANRFANVVHTVATPADMHRAMTRAVEGRAGWVYFTNRKLPNPYDGLPPYWTEETEDVAPSAFPE